MNSSPDAGRIRVATTNCRGATGCGPARQAVFGIRGDDRRQPPAPDPNRGRGRAVSLGTVDREPYPDRRIEATCIRAGQGVSRRTPRSGSSAGRASRVRPSDIADRLGEESSDGTSHDAHPGRHAGRDYRRNIPVSPRRIPQPCISHRPDPQNASIRGLPFSEPSAPGRGRFRTTYRLRRLARPWPRGPWSPIVAGR